MDDVTRSLRRVQSGRHQSAVQLGSSSACPGHDGVDFEERVDYRRLHKYRIGRVRQALETPNWAPSSRSTSTNIRYITSTKIGEWERDKLSRWALLTRGGEPILWDFGSAAVHPQAFLPLGLSPRT